MKKKLPEYNTKIDDHAGTLLAMVRDKGERKRIKAARAKSGTTPAVWLVSFDSRRKEEPFRRLELDVDAVILNAGPGDEVHLSIYTPGGAVTAYQNAAVQVARLRDAGLRVTAFVDEVAASGGYMMACVADEVVANPMAFVGSIGVVAQMPVAEDALKRVGVHVEMFTGGERKRSVVPWRNPSTEDKDVFQEKVEHMHGAFRAHVSRHRPNVGESVMDGDYFMAQDHVGTLVDRIGDSHTATLAAFRAARPIYRVHSEVKKSFSLKRLVGFDTIAEGVVEGLVERLLEARFTGIR